MSWRSGVFLKYVVTFVTPGLAVSNDVFAGDVCLDADVSVRMSRGTAGAAFEITLYDLPEAKVQALSEAAHSTTDKPHVTIELGYFDTSVAKVLDGIYESVETSVANDKLVTTVKGREAAFFACATTSSVASISGDVTYADAAHALLKNALPANAVSATAQVNDLPSATLHNPHFRSRKILGALDELATRAQAELMIVDGKVFLGSPIRNDDVAAAQIDRATNLANFQPLTRAIPADDDLNFPDPTPAATMNGFRFTVVGDATMRPGQKIVVKNVKNYDSAANPEYRIRQVEHQYSSTNGYVCVGVATKRLADGAQARQIDAAAERSAGSAARDVAGRIRSQAFDNPVVEIASVKAAGDAYTADLYYGQPAPGNETQPSLNVAVAHDDDNVYERKPIASPFAWRKCGLITPVYPGMKAVVTHNRAISSDAIVTSYIWSKEPDFAPPEYQTGDWWLCLPVNFDATQPPTDTDKAANDLTANDGRRVVELAGLKITVGASGLRTVGTRPTPGNAEECTIAHASGALVTIKKGEIDIDTGAGPKITLSSSGVTLTDGTLNVRLANGQLAIG